MRRQAQAGVTGGGGTVTGGAGGGRRTPHPAAPRHGALAHVDAEWREDVLECPDPRVRLRTAGRLRTNTAHRPVQGLGRGAVHPPVRSAACGWRGRGARLGLKEVKSQDTLQQIECRDLGRKLQSPPQTPLSPNEASHHREPPSPSPREKRRLLLGAARTEAPGSVAPADAPAHGREESGAGTGLEGGEWVTVKNAAFQRWTGLRTGCVAKTGRVACDVSACGCPVLLRPARLDSQRGRGPLDKAGPGRRADRPAAPGPGGARLSESPSRQGLRPLCTTLRSPRGPHSPWPCTGCWPGW